MAKGRGKTRSSLFNLRKFVFHSTLCPLFLTEKRILINNVVINPI